jgi:putative membrane protein
VKGQNPDCARLVGCWQSFHPARGGSFPFIVGMKTHRRKGTREEEAMTRLKGLCLVAVCALGSGALAQGAGQEQGQAAQPSRQMVEHKVLWKMHQTNQMEIQAGKLAQQQAGSPQVRAYGERLVRDHSFADQKVVQLAKALGVDLSQPVPLKPEEQAQMEQSKKMMQKLQSLQGGQFDQQYLTMMVKGHEKIIQSLGQALQMLGGSKVAGLVEDVRPILKQHRDLAQNLLGNADQVG